MELLENDVDTETKLIILEDGEENANCEKTDNNDKTFF